MTKLQKTAADRATTYHKIFHFTHDAWQIHCRNKTISTTDDYHTDHLKLCNLVGIDSENNNCEDWSCEITELDDQQHSLLQIGDLVVCGGYGSDVFICRETTDFDLFDHRTIDVDDVKIISCEQLQEGTVGDNPDHVFEVELPNNERGWVAGPHGANTCAIGEWLHHIGSPANSRDDAIQEGCD